VNGEEAVNTPDYDESERDTSFDRGDAILMGFVALVVIVVAIAVAFG